jgi:Protein of unknown function (DUF3592)
MAAKTRVTHKQAAKGGRGLGFLIGLGFLAFGVVASGWWGPMWLSAARHTRGYLTTPGVVEAIEVRSQSRTKGGRSYGLEVEYRYTVDGQSYQGNRWGAAGQHSSSSRKHIQGLVDQHPVGSAVEVFYNPADPQQAVLERGGENRAWLIIWLGAGFGALGLGLILFTSRQKPGSAAGKAPSKAPHSTSIRALVQIPAAPTDSDAYSGFPGAVPEGGAWTGIDSRVGAGTRSWDLPIGAG